MNNQKNNMKNILPIILVTLITACGSTQNQQNMNNVPAPVIIYKTKQDYSNLVPVTLNPLGTQIISFPGPNDLTFEGKPALPVNLHDEFLLDRRGINQYSAFTSYTYEEYAQLNAPPTTEALLNSIVDYDPFTVIYRCEDIPNDENLVVELNRRIRLGLKGCIPLVKENPE
jgi:hypothetical protein